MSSRFPDIRTYAGYGLDDPTATVRLDLTQVGFHALIFAGEGEIYIDPFQRGDSDHCISYYKRDYVKDKGLEGCTILDHLGRSGEIQRLVAQGDRLTGGQLRTYRTAIAADGE